MNNLKDFYDYLNQSLSSNIQYRDLSNLCLTLFCNVSVLPETFQSLKLDKESLANIFSKIAKEKMIPSYPSTASLYGASFHNTYDKGHWLEVMASILKMGNEPDTKEAEKLLVSSSPAGTNEIK
ncbi:hypothetical protein D1818_15935 [Aquimarina sp. BL5]|uniref:hypothetical protein n=1 Tax=Aquimarina sp. BL5 TaxID=1714860 RepID=UPI000E4DC9B9|nr:hypothetical protein [Aquimarina sp. BL5]AXT52256.1 hypothetical protein D1818_15935 [Aquimarina sp. BL5]